MSNHVKSDELTRNHLQHHSTTHLAKEHNILNKPTNNSFKLLMMLFYFVHYFGFCIAELCSYTIQWLALSSSNMHIWRIQFIKPETLNMQNQQGSATYFILFKTWYKEKQVEMRCLTIHNKIQNKHTLSYPSVVLIIIEGLRVMCGPCSNPTTVPPPCYSTLLSLWLLILVFSLCCPRNLSTKRSFLHSVHQSFYVWPQKKTEWCSTFKHLKIPSQELNDS